MTAVRAANAELLDCLDVAALDRSGTHTESGRYSVRDRLEIYIAHPQEHAAQITTAVAASAAGERLG
ncbi:MAG: hypothetical protein H0W01_11200 [Pseudonocardiales bacterium]|nr:hypothetical protein [Pseudonocardiales bacterium]